MPSSLFLSASLDLFLCVTFFCLVNTFKEVLRAMTDCLSAVYQNHLTVHLSLRADVSIPLEVIVRQQRGKGMIGRKESFIDV